MSQLYGTALVFLGAGVGGSIRHLLNLLIQRTMGDGFPWGILVINVTGSLAMGLAAGYFESRDASGGASAARIMLTTGLLGGYTTFSAYSLDAMALMEKGAYGLAALYVVGSVVLALVACGFGLAAARGFH
jgi:CrcB protein